MELPDLPVLPALDPLRKALAERAAAVLIAPPGAGKTTVVPLALLDAKWLGGRKVVVLEPRRLATRAAARRMASMLAERVGDTVGYRIRRDTRVGRRTRIEVVTEGVLTRMLQSDPTLDETGLVVFDEFHERSLHADLGLALALQAKRLFRRDLRLLVMSATLDAAPVAALLGDAPVIEAEGRAYPVRVRYRAASVAGHIEDAVASELGALLRQERGGEGAAGRDRNTAGRSKGAASRGDDGTAGRQADGDILAFLPGVGEIQRTVDLLSNTGLPSVVALHPLYRDLSRQEQDRAIAPSPPGRRKVVLATAIAQTSLTIEGVSAVVDSGLMRVPRFNPATGMSGLATLRVTADVAEQRRGRAGRTAPGVCHRLWTMGEQRGLVPQLRPEILDADLAPLMLELALWGAEPQELAWLDRPPAAALEQARELLLELNAISADGSVTGRGRLMSRLGVHPRLSSMLVRAMEMDRGALAADVAALLSGADVLHRSGDTADADLRLRVEALRRARRGGSPRDEEASGRLRRALEEARELRHAAGLSPRAEVTATEIEHTGELLALAYPDRIGRRREGQGVSDRTTSADKRGAREGVRYLLRNGRGAELPGRQSLGTSEWIVASDLGDRGRDARIYQAAPIDPTILGDLFAPRIEETDEVIWNEATQRVDATRRRRLGALVLTERSLSNPDAALMRDAMLEGVRTAGLRALPWSKQSRQLRERLQFMHIADPQDWHDVSEPALVASLPDWLGPFVSGMRRLEDLSRLDLAEILWTHAGWKHRDTLDKLAPTHLEVPSGSRIPLDYSDPDAPALAVRLQEVFGWTETPRIGGDRVAVTMRLLSPAQRPVQVTTDLASFWRDAYFEVKKDLKGRYPKHYWPDDPLSARPTRRTRPGPAG